MQSAADQKRELSDEEKLYPTHREFQEFHYLYESAIKIICTRLEVLNREYAVKYARSPIHHIESRLKSASSIVKKLNKKGLEVTAQNARVAVNDIAGVRVVCNYIDDVYRVEEILLRQNDIHLVKRQDYIKTPNFNGYRSLHIDVSVPVHLTETTENVLMEIQIRSVAMDFWASLEHDLRYKQDKENLPKGINEEMLACADEIAAIDRKMQTMYQSIFEDKS